MVNDSFLRLPEWRWPREASLCDVLRNQGHSEHTYA